MAAPPPVCGPCPPQFRYPPPQILNLHRPGFYVDEKQRFWMVSSLFFTPALYRLQPTLLRFDRSSYDVAERIFDILPGSDSSVWDLEQHLQTGVLEVLVLRLDGYVGAESEAPLPIHLSNPYES